MYYLESKIPGCEFMVETDEFIKDDSCLRDFDFCELDDLVYAIIDECSVDIHMPFSENDISTSALNNALKDTDYSLLSYTKESDLVTAKTEFSISSYLQERIREIIGEGYFDAQLSRWVESVLMDFVERSCWHIEPNRIWFAPENEIATRPWIVDSETSEEDFSLWFEKQSWETMSHLGDFTDGFLVWYTAECDRWVPDMGSIREKCPFQFTEIDTIETILEKAAKWCSKR